MAFLITLIALVVERFFDWGHLRQWGWFSRYQTWLMARVEKWRVRPAFIVAIVPVLLAVFLISVALGDWLYGLPRFVFGVFVLIYCLGPQNIWAQTYAAISSPEQARAAFAVDPNNHEAFLRAIFIAANQRIFAVLFWFVLLGPLGAVFYRLIAISAESDAMAMKVLQVLDWVPARLLTLTFALGGHFMRVVPFWKKVFTQGLSSSNDLVADCGIAALDMDSAASAEKQALALLDRAFVISLVLLAIFVLMS